MQRIVRKDQKSGKEMDKLRGQERFEGLVRDASLTLQREIWGQIQQLCKIRSLYWIPLYMH